MARKERCRFRAERNALRHAIRRCTREDHISWPSYGGRGITVVDEWNTPDFEDGLRAFISHIGPRPSSLYSLDRIDNDKGYEAGNVRWADRTTQAANKRRRCPPRDYGWGVGRTAPIPQVGRGGHASQLIEHEGKLHTVAEWAREIDISPATIRQRAQRGWPAKRVLAPHLFNPHNQPRA